MFHSVAFIELVHTVLFVVLSVVLILFVYEVVMDRITSLTWIAVGLFSVEGIVLIVNGWKCPLTTVSEARGSMHGQITDRVLPKWFADRVFVIYGCLYAVGVLVLVVRLLGWI